MCHECHFHASNKPQVCCILLICVTLCFSPLLGLATHQNCRLQKIMYKKPSPWKRRARPFWVFCEEKRRLWVIEYNNYHYFVNIKSQSGVSKQYILAAFPLKGSWFIRQFSVNTKTVSYLSRSDLDTSFKSTFVQKTYHSLRFHGNQLKPASSIPSTVEYKSQLVAALSVLFS